MTLLTAMQRVRTDLEDSGIRYYSDSDIQTSLQDGYFFSSVFANTIEKTVDLNYASITPYYDLPSLIPDFFAVVAIYDNQKGRFLAYRSRIQLQQSQLRYELWSGSPELFCVVDYRRVLLLPRLEIGTGTFKVFYRAMAATLTSIDSFLLPKTAEESPLFWAMFDLLEQSQEMDKAEVWLNKFLDNVGEAKERMSSRPLPALIRQFKETTT